MDFSTTVNIPSQLAQSKFKNDDIHEVISANQRIFSQLLCLIILAARMTYMQLGLPNNAQTRRIPRFCS